jgi:guanylate kinase
LLILSSPSGAGKSTLARRLMEWDPSLRFSVSATTRAPRPGETDGREYYFKTRTEFESMVAAGEMLEHAEVFGNFYGSPKGPVETAMTEGRDTLFDIDWQGGQQIRNSSLGRDVVSVFVLPPSIAELERRLRGRAQDSDEVIAGRMAKSQSEISHWAEYDYVIVNNDIDIAFNDLLTILQAERMRRDRQPGMAEFVRGLNKEFDAR